MDTTDRAEPEVATGSAAHISASSAVLQGTVYPNGRPTWCWFVYGAFNIPVEATPRKIVGAGRSARSCSETVIGLMPNTTYYFRVVAENSDGVAVGALAWFSTAELPEAPALSLVELDVDPGGGVVVPAGFHALGSYSSAAPGTALAARALQPGALALPIDFVRACAVENLWKPVPPPGYVALGLVESAEKPALGSVRCVHEDLTTRAFLAPEVLDDQTRAVVPAGPGGLYLGTFANAWELLATAPVFSNLGGGTEARYYRTLRAADLDGDGRDEIVVRGWSGLHVYALHAASGKLHRVGFTGPFPDDEGADQPSIYETLRVADVDGDGLDEILGRDPHGVVVYRFDAGTLAWSALGTHGPFSDADGWNRARYFETIQTADLDADGREELLARGDLGMQVYRFDGGTWVALDLAGPFTSLEGWDPPQYAQTIQTADLDGDGKAELLGRGPSGMQIYRFEEEAQTWLQVASTGPFTDVDGWDQPKYYRSIRAADVDGDGSDEVLGRGWAGISVYRYDLAGRTWVALGSDAVFASNAGWDAPRYHESIQTADIDGDGRAELLARGPDGVVIYAWDTKTASWLADPYGPPFSDAAGFGDADNYRTLQTADLDGDGMRDLLVRADSGLLAYRLVATSARWVGTKRALPTLDAQMVEVPEPLTRDQLEAFVQSHGPIVALHETEDYFPDDPLWSLDHGIRLAWGLVEHETSYEDFRLTEEGSIGTSAESLQGDVKWLLAEVMQKRPYQGRTDFRYWLDVPDAMQPGQLERATTVVRVVPWNHLWTELQFWVFYPYNGPARARICLSSSRCKDLQLEETGRHDGDWEHITLRLRNRTQEVDAIHLSGHSGGRWVVGREQLATLKHEDAHPVVFAARYSHANYANEGLHDYARLVAFDWPLGRFSVDLVDETASSGASFFRTSQEGRQAWMNAKDSEPPPPWLAFEGRWGGYERLLSVFEYDMYAYTHGEVGRGPTSPGQSPMWNAGISGEMLGLK